MTTPDQRGYAPENEGRPEPTLVQYKDQDFEAHVAFDDRSGVTPSANRAFWARAVDDGYTESNRASNAAQMAAFAEYQTRPDIESRASILAREHAAPAEFENVVVPNGNFDAAVANTDPTNKSGYIGVFDFEDHNGEKAAASNGQGQVGPAEYSAVVINNPGTRATVDTDADGTPDYLDAAPADPLRQATEGGGEAAPASDPSTTDADGDGVTADVDANDEDPTVQ